MAKKPSMPAECCGNCVFAHDVMGQPYYLCMASPPFPVPDEIEDGVTWERGGAVEATDPRCFYYKPKGMV